MKTFAIGVVALMALVFAAFAVKPEQVPVTQPETEPETKQVEPEPKAEKSIEEKFVYIQMKTSKGEIFIELNNELAPISTANFVRYAEEGFYNETIFHRVISNFMIQGGGFDKDMKQKKPHEGIENEWKNGLSNKRGTIAMARLGGQANSGTSQFFINVADNGFLDQPRDGSGYAVFGKVVKGMDVVDAIRVVRTTQKGHHGDVPVEPVMIEKVTVLAQEKAAELGLVESEG